MNKLLNFEFFFSEFFRRTSFIEDSAFFFKKKICGAHWRVRRFDQVHQAADLRRSADQKISRCCSNFILDFSVSLFCFRFQQLLKFSSRFVNSLWKWVSKWFDLCYLFVFFSFLLSFLSLPFVSIFFVLAIPHFYLRSLSLSSLFFLLLLLHFVIIVGVSLFLHHYCY